MNLNAEDLQKGIPAYLSAADKEALVKALKDFPNTGKTYPYFFDQHDSDPLQGDVWRGLEVVKFEDGSRKRILGMLISNSCDISPENKRYFPPKLSFAALIPLEKYRQALLNSQVSIERVEEHLTQIRAQSVTSLFYIPPGSNLQVEHIALLQDIHSLPLSSFLADSAKTRLASLNQLAFYLLLFKLSIHFCRFMEGVERGSVEAITKAADAS